MVGLFICTLLALDNHSVLDTATATNLPLPAFSAPAYRLASTLTAQTWQRRLRMRLGGDAGATPHAVLARAYRRRRYLRDAGPAAAHATEPLRRPAVTLRRLRRGL